MAPPAAEHLSTPSDDASSPASSGMKVGLCKLAFFACLVALFAFLLNVVIQAGLRNIHTSSFGVWNRIVAGDINAAILVSGSSRALSHYDPRVIQERTKLATFNIGLNGSQTDMQLARLKTYLLHNRKPLLLIHNIDLFSFQITRGGVYDPGQYLPYLGQQPIYDALSRFNPHTWKARYWPLYGYAVEDLRLTWVLGLLGSFGWNPQEDHFLGFKPRDLAWTEDFKRFRAANPQGTRFEIEPEGVQQMEDMLRLCKAEGISVLLVYSPEYEEMQRMTINRVEIFARLDVMRDRFHVAVWNFSSLPLASQKNKFYNSQHLNAEGAKIFSTELAEKLATDAALLVRSGPPDDAAIP